MLCYVNITQVCWHENITEYHPERLWIRFKNCSKSHVKCNHKRWIQPLYFLCYYVKNYKPPYILRRKPFSPMPDSVVVKCILWIKQAFSQHYLSQMQANKINIKKINFIASSIFVLVLIAGFIFIASMPSKVISVRLSFVPMQMDRERIQFYAVALMGKSAMAARTSHNEWVLSNVTSLKFSLLSKIYHMSIHIPKNHISWYVIN